LTPKTKSLRLFQAAFFCGVAPCFAASLVFDFWLITRHPGLAVAAVAILLCMPVLLILAGAFMALRVHVERALGASSESEARDRRLGGVVLLANLVVGALLAGVVFVSSESYSISVRNRGAVAIDSFAVVDPGRSERLELGAFAPGEERTAAIHIEGKTTLTFEMVRFGQTSTGTVVGYTEPDLSADQWSTITVGDDGKAVVEESSNAAL
jgi:hypothetical protein